MSKRQTGEKYPTLRQAATAALALGIHNSIDYQARYREDPLLPSGPDSFYPDWAGWYDFFGKPEPKHYDSLKDASKAAIALGIKTMAEYARRYKEDPRLPSNPHRIYRHEWENYPVFFGLEPRSFYATYKEASAAAKALGIKSYAEYMKRYREDPLLTSLPQNRYKSEWVNWHLFLGVRKRTFYKTYAEAKRVTQCAGVTTVAEYAQLARKNSRLPSAPNNVYKSDWEGWPSFLSPRKSRFHESYGEAKRAVRAIGIATRSDYRLRYKLDPKLPSAPSQIYAEEWSGWSDFLGGKARRRASPRDSGENSITRQLKTRAKQRQPAYESYKEAAKAARALGVSTKKDYEQGYSLDPKLRSNPHQIYKASWRGWGHFLIGKDTSIYRTYAEAKRAVIALKIRTSREYAVRYKEDPRLPSNPHITYKKQWESFPSFTGNSGPSKYRTLEDAARATQALGIKSVAEYQRRFREDSKLPHNPPAAYVNEWKNWHAFLGKRVPEFYPTYSEAKMAVRLLNIRSRADYMRRYKEDPHLPSNPQMIYKKEWESFPSFTGNSGPSKYRALEDAARAAQALGIKSVAEYRRRYREDSKLPYNPPVAYGSGWKNWHAFLGKRGLMFYSTYSKAKMAVKRLNIRSSIDYARRYKEDPLLPSNPNTFYPDDWEGWKSFLEPQNQRNRAA